MKKLNDKQKNVNLSEKGVKSLTKSLYTSFFLFLILIFIFVMSHFTYRKSTWADSLFISSMVYLCLVGFWILLRFGFAETTILRVKNYQRFKGNKYNNEQKLKTKLTLDDTRKKRLDKEWIGPWVSLSVGTILLIISLIFSYI